MVPEIAAADGANSGIAFQIQLLLLYSSLASVKDKTLAKQLAFFVAACVFILVGLIGW